MSKKVEITKEEIKEEIPIIEIVPEEIPIEVSEVTKPKKTRKKTETKVKTNTLQTDIEKLFEITNTIAKLKAPIWELSTDEIKMLSAPLSKILSQIIPESAGKYTDIIMLISAIGMITLPRAIVQININKMEKNKKEIIKSGNYKEDKGNERKINQGNNGNDSHVARVTSDSNNVSNNVKEFYSIANNID
jgi:hypothetical protein